MAKIIDDETMENVCILAKLSLTEEAKEKGFSKMELDVWEFNEDAREFYKAAGFQTYRRYMELNVL